jgi:hypothetical protein
VLEPRRREEQALIEGHRQAEDFLVQLLRALQVLGEHGDSTDAGALGQRADFRTSFAMLGWFGTGRAGDCKRQRRSGASG